MLLGDALDQEMGGDPRTVATGPNSTMPVEPPVPMEPPPSAAPPAAPNAPARQVGNVLQGWDATKWANPEHNTPKYQAGRILSKYNLQDANERGLAEQELLAAFPGSTFDQRDALYIPSLGPKGIDIYGGASRGEYRPQWLDLNAADAQPGAVPPGPSAAAPRSGVNSLGDLGGAMGDDLTIDAILREIQKLIDPAQAQALLGGALEQEFR